MSNPYRPNAKIKDVYVELKDYFFHHTPHDDTSESKKRYVGRKKIKERIKLLLQNSSSGAGTYLITGFRGMGKTTILRQAINEVNNGEEGSNSSWLKKNDFKGALLRTLVTISKLFFIVYSFLIFKYAILDSQINKADILLQKLGIFEFNYGDYQEWIRKATEEILNVLKSSPDSILSPLDSGISILITWLAFLPLIIRIIGLFLSPYMTSINYLRFISSDYKKAKFLTKNMGGTFPVYHLFFNLCFHTTVAIALLSFCWELDVINIFTVMIPSFLVFCSGLYAWSHKKRMPGPI